jgi:hypothetical protein
MSIILALIVLSGLGLLCVIACGPAISQCYPVYTKDFQPYDKAAHHAELYTNIPEPGSASASERSVNVSQEGQDDNEMTNRVLIESSRTVSVQIAPPATGRYYEKRLKDRDDFD